MQLSASGVGRSNAAPCTLVTTLLIGGSSVFVSSPAVGAVWLLAGRGCSCPVFEFVGGVAAAFIGCAWTGVSGCVIAMSAPTHGQDGCYGGFDIESKLSRAYMYV
jgi:hypothetical protein